MVPVIINSKQLHRAYSHLNETPQPQAFYTLLNNVCKGQNTESNSKHNSLEHKLAIQQILCMWNLFKSG